MRYHDLATLLDIIKTVPNADKRDEATKLIMKLGADTDPQAVQLSNDTNKQLVKKQGENGLFLKFTHEEISKLPMRFRKEFYIRDRLVRCYRRQSGKYTVNYEIRYRRHGFNVYVCSNDLEEAKRKFIEEMWGAEDRLKAKEKGVRQYPKVPTTFHEFAEYYFEKYRKRKVSPKTFENDNYRYKNYLRPYFGNMKLKEITAMMCQDLLDEIQDKGLTKTNNEVYSLLNGIFKMAIAHDLMTKNPLAIVIVEKHKSKSGKALTKEQEKHLLDSVKGTKYELIMALALYTGLRPNELYTAKIDGDFIVAKNSKRKGGKIESKKIPITVMLRPYLQGVTEFKFPGLQYVREVFNAALPHNVFYDLRRTFYTRCDECGVAESARDEFVGHSKGELTNTYRDLSDEYLLKEGAKLVW